MNREIKFRAWDGKRMIYQGSGYYISFSGKSLAQIVEPMAVDMKYFGSTDKFNYKNIKNYKIMQYTGLLDRNGREIYEGDIVKAISDPEFGKEQDCISDVVFNDNGGWQIRTPPDGDCVYEHGLSVNWGGWVSVEIIGNIYEHPELLGE